jgi:acyl-CoA thioester hydrolase
MCEATQSSPVSAPATPDLSAQCEIRAEFFDIDPMEVVWHGNYVRYLESARAVLLEKFNYGYPQMRQSGYSWPVVDMRLKYVAPVVYAQRITVQARIVEWENRLRITYMIRDAQSGQKLTIAHTTQVAIDMSSGSMCFVCPPVLWERLGVMPCSD